MTSAEQNPAWRCLTLLLVSLRLQNELQRDLGQVRIKSLYVFITNPRPSDQRVDVIFFTILQVAGGQLLLPLLVMTIFLSKRVKRHPVFINFCISWIASSVTFCLLYVPLHNSTDRVNQLILCHNRIYQGRSQDGPLNSISRDSCIAQASLINGVQGLWVAHYIGWILMLTAVAELSQQP